ncbi:MAG: NADH-quinone oxidoreductase subunit A [Bdellovibrionaceae bacterium]|nr:NADH-quinone oxidoreductase subunit A [Pseudobdellovibrionaceae bacterium]|tara:strand:+ start:153517 stop:153888 length:372 start_codon:yes stop_codon:yes gene_type:complete
MASIVPVLVLTAIVVGFGIFLVVVTGMLGPKLPQSELKKKSYECGIEVQETGHSKIPIKFYLTAILFILFDIEIIFMYPWAVTFADSITGGYGLQVLLAMGVFLFVFIVGLFWEVKSKALEWE